VRIKILYNQITTLPTEMGGTGVEKFVAARRDAEPDRRQDLGRSGAAGWLPVGAGGLSPVPQALGKELLRLHGESCLAGFQLSSFPHSMAVPAAFTQGCTLARKRAVLFR